MPAEIRLAVSDADWAHVQAIRRRVFVLEQDVPDADEWDGWDAPALRGDAVHHLLATLEGEPVGVARWRAVVLEDETWAKLERFAVVPEGRGAGIGRALVGRALGDARAAGRSRFVLHAQTYVAGLYRAFGFQAEGDVFLEDGLEHVKMTLVDA
ncbi:GNAT family N-acetyltransferase [Rubrivirga sp.]|uniref:GNAT family N-acetyltransferase n=1 Tax=Rubrivirga sp. TaxID=1885344 RepID=UPI003C739DF4